MDYVIKRFFAPDVVDEDSSISANVRYTPPTEAFLPKVTSTMDLRDCNRKITIEFYVYGGENSAYNRKELLKDIKLKRKKIRALVDSISEFAEKYELALSAAEAAAKSASGKAKKNF